MRVTRPATASEADPQCEFGGQIRIAGAIENLFAAPLVISHFSFNLSRWV